MRSPEEIQFRLRQEWANARYFAFPPRLPEAGAGGQGSGPFSSWPAPGEVARRLAGTPFATECVRVAEEVLQHRFPLLGTTLDAGKQIHWRRDYATGRETVPVYFRRVPYLDVAQAGDHKTIWELSRHQHLVLLAQAYLFTTRQEFLAEIVAQLEDWLEQNPFQRGMNWTSALEVAFRALSWIWVLHLVGDRFEAAFRRRLLEALYRHGLHLEVNLSFYFSPNTHLLGEAVALHAIGYLFPQFPGAGKWRKLGADVVRKELDRQVLADGSYFELSTYYHVYAVDMFLFHAVLAGDREYSEPLTRMAAFLDAVLGISGILPLIGDDDGGRFFHPYGPRDRYGLATLAACGVFLGRPEWIRDERDLAEQALWWIGKAPVGGVVSRESKRFEASGLVVMAAHDVQVIVDAGGFGPGRAGHSHADALSMVVRAGQEEILIDPGTYTYVADPVWRDRFRGTAAHNSVRVNGLDQAIPSGPFAWQSRPVVKVLEWETSVARDMLTAMCEYRDVVHRRKIVFDKRALWVMVLDEVEAGEQAGKNAEQFWHFGVPARQVSPGCVQVGAKALMAFENGAPLLLSEGGEYGWRSPALGQKQVSPVLRVERAGAALIDLSGRARTVRFHLDADRLGATVDWDGQVDRLRW